ncbi:MAG: hypothetical protein ACYC8T_01340 [Myxococcaceae bacterium]
MDKPRKRTPQAPKYPLLKEARAGSGAAFLGAVALAGSVLLGPSCGELLGGVAPGPGYQDLYPAPDGGTDGGTGVVAAEQQVLDAGPTPADNFGGAGPAADFEDLYPEPDGGNIH